MRKDHLTPKELIKILEALIEWCGQTGDWSAPAWQEDRDMVRRNQERKEVSE